MTLLIAYLLMYHIGDFSTESYLGVLLLWVLHIVYHHAPSAKDIAKYLNSPTPEQIAMKIRKHFQ